MRLEAPRRNEAIDIVFFDAGETLVHPYPSFPELFARVAADNGHDVAASHVAEVQERLAPHLVDLADDCGVENPSFSPEDSVTFWTFLYRRFLEELGIEHNGLDRRLYDIFSSSSSYRLFDDALPALDGLQDAGYRLGLISNFEGWLETMLVELEVGHHFDTTVISGIERVEKPDPRIYEIALERAGVDSARAVHVGDSLGLDVEPARTVGIRPVLVDRVGRYPDPDCLSIRSLKELPDALTNL